MKMWPFLYSLQFETGVIRAGVNGAGVKKGPALKGPIRYIYVDIDMISIYIVVAPSQFPIPIFANRKKTK